MKKIVNILAAFLVAFVAAFAAIPNLASAQSGVSAKLIAEQGNALTFEVSAQGTYRFLQEGNIPSEQLVAASVAGKVTFVTKPGNSAFKVDGVQTTSALANWVSCSTDGWYCRKAGSPAVAQPIAVATSVPAASNQSQGTYMVSPTTNCVPMGWKGYSKNDTLSAGFGSTVTILAESNGETVVLKIVGVPEIYLQGDDAAGGPKIFNSRYPVNNGIVKAPRLGALAMEVKFACALTSENANYVSHDDGWFEWHGPVFGQVTPVPTPVPAVPTAAPVPTKALVEVVPTATPYRTLPTATPPAVVNDIVNQTGIPPWVTNLLGLCCLPLLVLLALGYLVAQLIRNRNRGNGYNEFYRQQAPAQPPASPPPSPVVVAPAVPRQTPTPVVAPAAPPNNQGPAPAPAQAAGDDQIPF